MTKEQYRQYANELLHRIEILEEQRNEVLQQRDELLGLLKIVRIHLPGSVITDDMGKCEKCGAITKTGLYNYCDKCLHKKINNTINRIKGNKEG